MSIREVTALPGRVLLVWSNPKQKLFAVPILEFIIWKTAQLLDEELEGLDHEDAAALVSAQSGVVAELLVHDGWFSRQEYIDALAESEAAEIDDDLDALFGAR